MSVVAGASGFAVRRLNFPDEIEFYAPGLRVWKTSEWAPSNPRGFVGVSVTGTGCALKCAHCYGRSGPKVLQGMIAIPAGGDLYELAVRLRAEGTWGILLSGGSTRTGIVPLIPHLKHVPRIREELGMRVVVHAGVVDQAHAEALARARVDGVMLDIIGARETIREVYHLDRGPEDFERALALLAEREVPIIPHVVCGLHFGRFLGEYRALEMVARYPVRTFIIVVLVPLAGTQMERVSPPAIEDVIAFMEAARLTLPRIKINLGCARPLGEYKERLDRAAIDHGLNGIAYPAEGVIEYALQRGLRPKFYESCCALPLRVFPR